MNTELIPVDLMGPAMTQGFVLGVTALICAGLVAWVDHRTRARLEGRRRIRNGLLGGFTRVVAILARGPRPRFAPVLAAAFSLLPALMLVTILLPWVLPPGLFSPDLLMAGATSGPGPHQLLWWLALGLSSAVAGRWALMLAAEALPWHRAGRRILGNTTPWVGLGVALSVLLLGVSALPANPHPIAAVTLVVTAGLWRCLDARAGHAGSAVTEGAALVLTVIASHLMVAALILAAIIVSGFGEWTSSQSTLTASGLVVIVFLFGIFLSRLASTVLLPAPTPQRLRTFTWARLLPLALVECVFSAALLARGVGG